MRIENGKRVRNRRGDKVPLTMVSFRAEPSVVEMLAKQMEIEQIENRSEFIVRALTEYCERNGGK